MEFLAGVVGIRAGSSIFDSRAFRTIENAHLYDIVPDALDSKKRNPKSVREERATLSKGQKQKKKDDTICSKFPDQYCINFHKAVAKLRLFDKNLPAPNHTYCNLLVPNNDGKYFVYSSEGCRFV